MKEMKEINHLDLVSLFMSEGMTQEEAEEAAYWEEVA